MAVRKHNFFSPGSVFFSGWRAFILRRYWVIAQSRRRDNRLTIAAYCRGRRKECKIRPEKADFHILISTPKVFSKKRKPHPCVWVK